MSHYLASLLSWMFVAANLWLAPILYRHPLPDAWFDLATDIAAFGFLFCLSCLALWSAIRRRWWAPHMLLAVLLASAVAFGIDSGGRRYQLDQFDVPPIYATWWWYCDGFGEGCG